MPSKNEPPRDREFVAALAHGLAVIEAFGRERREMSLSEIARTVELTPATVRRALLTLRVLGYVGQSGKLFHLRPRVAALGSAFYFASRVEDLLEPELRGLVAAFHDAASITVLDGADVLYIAHHSEERARRRSATVGARYPAHATSVGQVLLAGLDEERLQAWLATTRLIALTQNTVTDASALIKLVSKARLSGYAISVDQLDYGISAIAVPIRNQDGRVIAAINSSGYTGHVSARDLLSDRLPPLLATARRIEELLTLHPTLQRVLSGD